MKTLLSYSLLLALLAGSCHSSEPAATTPPDCIDAAKVKTDMMCTMQYDPVCGCDGKTYGNACEADKAGVTRTTPGECPGKAN